MSPLLFTIHYRRAAASCRYTLMIDAAIAADFRHAADTPLMPLFRYR